MQKFTFSFTGRKSGAIGIVYKIKKAYQANDIEEAISLLYKDYEHISGLKCNGGKTEIPITV
jgi:hypothetical protein